MPKGKKKYNLKKSKTSTRTIFKYEIDIAIVSQGIKNNYNRVRAVMEREGNVQEQVNHVKRNMKSYESLIRQCAHNEIIFKRQC